MLLITLIALNFIKKFLHNCAGFPDFAGLFQPCEWRQIPLAGAASAQATAWPGQMCRC